MKEEIKNPRKDMNLYKLWLTEQEERILLKALKEGINSISYTIIKKAHERGDFYK